MTSEVVLHDTLYLSKGIQCWQNRYVGQISRCLRNIFVIYVLDHNTNIIKKIPKSNFIKLNCLWTSYKLQKVLVVSSLQKHERNVKLSCISQSAPKREARSMNMSSLHGIVRPPMGWLYPNSSSA